MQVLESRDSRSDSPAVETRASVFVRVSLQYILSRGRREIKEVSGGKRGREVIDCPPQRGGAQANYRLTSCIVSQFCQAQ